MDKEIQKFCPSCRKFRKFKYSYTIPFEPSGKPFEYVYKCPICDYKIYQPVSEVNNSEVVK